MTTEKPKDEVTLALSVIEPSMDPSIEPSVEPSTVVEEKSSDGNNGDPKSASSCHQDEKKGQCYSVIHTSA